MNPLQADLVQKIERLKKIRKAAILAHNYQIPEVQDVADFVGDSLEMAKYSLELEAEVIVVAGVYFMGETVAALNPDRIVLTPEPLAGCPLASSLTPEIAKKAKEENPNTPFVVYINSFASSKIYADYIVTSSSAVRLVSKLDCDKIIFGPDANLAKFVEERTGKMVIPVPQNGHCPVHHFLIDCYWVEKALKEHPKALLAIHPEAPAVARKHAHFVGSTTQMLNFVASNDASEFLLGTEEGLVYRARKLCPQKSVYPVNSYAVCTEMKKINLLKVVESLEKMKHRIKLDERDARIIREKIEASMEMVR